MSGKTWTPPKSLLECHENDIAELRAQITAAEETLRQQRDLLATLEGREPDCFEAYLRRTLLDSPRKHKR